jgi:cysteine-rich repeat protein
MESRKGTTLWSSLVSIAFVFALAGPTQAQNTCDVEIALADPGPVSVLAYGVDYSGAGGSFMGTGFYPACTRLVTAFENTIYDDDAGLLSNFVASQTGVSAPEELISCVFALDAGFPCPPSSAFTVTDASFPATGPVTLEEMFPGLSAAAVTITVTPRIPVCGDGFQEGTEQCDDGNVADGDCCSTACVLDAAGAACDDGSVCTSGETCDAAGACNPASITTCDDGDPCTTDTCDGTLGCTAALLPAHVSACDYGGQGYLKLGDDGSAKRKLQLLSVSHQPTTPASVGNPTVDTSYAVCIYDETANVPALAARIDVPAGAGWQAINPTRFQYKDATGSVNGVQRLRVDGKTNGSKVQLHAKGSNLPLPGPVATDRYFARDNEVIVQLRNTVGGCWHLSLSSEQKNTATEFKAKRK